MDKDKKEAPGGSEEENQELTALQKELADEKAARATEAEGRKLAEKLAADKEAALAGTVAELKKLREKKGEGDVEGKDAAVDIDAKIAEALNERTKKEAESNEKAAIARFQSENKDFHSDNDPGGLKMSALLKEFANFNTSSAYSVEEFTNYLDKARRLVSPNKGEKPDSITDDPSIKAAGGKPKAADPTKLTAVEREAIAQIGWDEERYLKNKAKNPLYVKQLLGL